MAAGQDNKPKGLRELDDLEEVFRALAHESRRHILQVLQARGGQMTAGQIAARFSCRWPTTTRHLGVLRQAGLVHVRSEGRERVYRLDTDRLHRVVGGWLRSFGQRSTTPTSGGQRREPS